MDSHDVVPLNPPQIEGEELSEAEADAIRAGDRRGKRGPMTLNEIHEHMSLVVRRMRRGRITKQEGNRMLDAYTKVAAVAEQVEERQLVRQFLEQQRSAGELPGGEP